MIHVALRPIFRLGLAGLGLCLTVGGCKIPDSKMAQPFAWVTPTNMPRRLDSTVIPEGFTGDRPRDGATNENSSTPLPGVPLAPPLEPEKHYSFSARDLEMRDALALFAKDNSLNIVPDQEIKGTVTVEFHDLPLAKAMEALLEAFGFYAEVDHGLVRVRETRTETFTVDYIRLVRGGNGSSSANVGSSSVSGAGSMTGGGKDVANITINQNDSIKFWDELSEQLKPLVTPSGRVSVNRMAGTIMVTDRKANVDQIGQYLESIKKTLHRQVDIEARIYEVVLRDAFQFGIDWQNVTARLDDYVSSSGGLPTGIPSSSLIVANPLGGEKPGAPAISLQVSHKDARAIINALQEMGNLKIVSQPRIRTLNNQSAMIKVGEDKPFFRETSTTVPSSGGQPIISKSIDVQTVTIGTVLSLTPQISEDGWITMDISPIITRLTGTASSGDGTTAPEVDIKQTSSLVRMRDNTTVIIGGLIQDEHTKSTRKAPILGDIPLLGYLFRGKYESTQKTELVIFITPTIVR